MRILSTGRKSGAKNSGFTLLELLVVLMIMGIVSAFVGPKLAGSISNTDLRTASKKIAALLRYARSQATSQGVICGILFDFEKGRISIVTKQGRAEAAQDKDNSAEKEKEMVGRSKTYNLPDGVRLEKAISGNSEIDSGLFEIIFFPSGSSSGGRVTLVNKRGRRYAISVDFITGTVKLGEVKSQA